MGPRREGRGNLFVLQIGQLGHVASMGPRREGRGNSNWQSNRITIIMLQWGRVAKDAETCRFAARTPRNRQASMGPRREGRGNDVTVVGHTASSVLQWGRVAKDAETEGVSYE